MIMFKKRRSLKIFPRTNSLITDNHDCIHEFGFLIAYNVCDPGLAGFGLLKRKLLTGRSAYGRPKNATTSFPSYSSTNLFYINNTQST